MTELANYQEIVFSGKEKTIQVETDAITWGKQVIRSLNLGSLSDFEKAQRICTYLSNNFSYNFQRSLSIREIIERQGGNCVSHTLMGIFLLRLAGIPAKFAHEVHLTKPYRLISLYVGLWAKRENDGINSFWHNDHVWVWFLDNGAWEPFDSALGVCGFNQFFEKRFHQQKELSKGFAQKWTGPPFVVWEGEGDGLTDMKNVTSTIINPVSMAALKYKDELQELVDTFTNWKQEDFHREYLSEKMIHNIKVMSRKWFKN